MHNKSKIENIGIKLSTTIATMTPITKATIAMTTTAAKIKTAVEVTE